MHLLNAKLREWKPETAAEVRERGTEIIGLADQDLLDLLRSRTLEQNVLDILAPSSRFNPTAFQAVSFERPVPRLRQWEDGGIQA
jgi:hypothetical protein